jgi:hypothetical protein
VVLAAYPRRGLAGERVQFPYARVRAWAAALLLHEPVGLRDLGGLAAIALGISLVQRN